MAKKLEAIFIGSHFYNESGTIMSSIYLADGTRYDYGLLQTDLANGATVTIRPATVEEYGWYDKQLEELKRARRG